MMAAGCERGLAEPAAPGKSTVHWDEGYRHLYTQQEWTATSERGLDRLPLNSRLKTGRMLPHEGRAWPREGPRWNLDAMQEWLSRTWEGDPDE